MIKIIAIYDQIQSGLGTKDDKMLPLGGKNVPVGPSIMMEPFLRKVDARVVACLYCGNGTYLNNKEMVIKKLCDKIQKLHPDVVICGPAFNFRDYAEMCAEITYNINKFTDVPAIASMSAENEEVIRKFKDSILIVKCPKKGDAGLNNALENLCQAAKSLASHDNTENIKEYCF